jgi:excisionase family DNA binding protein
MGADQNATGQARSTVLAVRFSVVRFTDAELDEIRQLFRERVQSVQSHRRPRARSRRPPTLALRADVAQPDDNAILRPRELAALLGVSPSTLGRWASDGYVPCFRTLGGQWRFRWADVRARIAN